MKKPMIIALALLAASTSLHAQTAEKKTVASGSSDYRAQTAFQEEDGIEAADNMLTRGLNRPKEHLGLGFTTRNYSGQDALIATWHPGVSSFTTSGFYVESLCDISLSRKIPLCLQVGVVLDMGFYSDDSFYQRYSRYERVSTLSLNFPVNITYKIALGKNTIQPYGGFYVRYNALANWYLRLSDEFESASKELSLFDSDYGDWARVQVGFDVGAMFHFKRFYINVRSQYDLTSINSNQSTMSGMLGVGFDF